MKRIFIVLTICLTCLLSACVVKQKTNSNNEGSTTQVKSTYTVAFTVEGERFKTLRVESGSKIEAEIGTPQKDGYSFIGWYLNDEKIDLSTYVVTGAVTFEARFEKQVIDESLVIDGVKDPNASYYVVIGWWEVSDPDDPTKTTSNLTPNSVRLFYMNVITYLKKAGATDDEISKIQFRNYSTKTVADMGALINADQDVDLLIGVGNNINSSAGVSLLDDNAGKFAAEMGSPLTSRYVALPVNANKVGINLFDYLKTDDGKRAFTDILSADDITVVPERSDEINLTVTVHGDTDTVTTLLDGETTINFGTITVPENNIFMGFATNEDSTEVKLNVALTQSVTYKDVKTIINVGDTALDLYPVFKEMGQVERTSYAVIAWYSKESTSGLNAEIIAQVEAGLKAYLKTQSVSDEDIATIVFKGYDGNVGPTTEAILEDGDVDIMLGWGNNISTTGKIPATLVQEDIQNVAMGEKAGRTIHLLTDNEGVKVVFDYFKTPEGQKLFIVVTPVDLTVTVHGDTDTVTELEDSESIINFGTITVPEGYTFLGFTNEENGTEVKVYASLESALTYNSVKELLTDGDTTLDLYPVFQAPDVVRENYVVIGWYDKEATSGLNADIIAQVEAGLKDYLKTQGVGDEELATIVFKGYDGNVGPSTELIMADGNVDIILGWGSNITTTGNIPESIVQKSVDGVTMGEKTGRMMHLLSSHEDPELVFTFLSSEDGQKLFVIVNEIELTVTIHGDTDAVTNVTTDKDSLTMPTITVGENKVFKGYSLTQGGEVDLVATLDQVLTYASIKNLVADNATTLDLYPVFEDVTPEEKTVAVVMIQVYNNYLTQAEAEEEAKRINAILSENEEVSIIIVNGDAETFTTSYNDEEVVDVVIGGNSPLKNFTTNENGALANCGAGHFTSTNRKVIISSKTAELTLAKKIYNFMVADYTEENNS